MQPSVKLHSVVIFPMAMLIFYRLRSWPTFGFFLLKFRTFDRKIFRLNRFRVVFPNAETNILFIHIYENTSKFMIYIYFYKTVKYLTVYAIVSVSNSIFFYIIIYSSLSTKFDVLKLFPCYVNILTFAFRNVGLYNLLV